MSLLSKSEAGTFQLLVRERQAVIEQLLTESPADSRRETGLDALLHELVLMIEAPIRTGAGRRRARRQLRLGLGELLDRCDRISVTNPELALSHASDYMAFGCVSRARRLLESTLSRFKTRNDVRLELARVLIASRHFNRALTHFEFLCADEPDNPSLCREAAKAATWCLSIDKAIDYLEHLLRLCPEDTAVVQDLCVAREVQESRREATLPNSVPSISLEVSTDANGPAQELRLALAEQLYRQYGTLLIHNVYDPKLIRRCQQQFLSEYEPLIQEKMKTQRGLSRSRRLKVSLALAGDFNTPGFYANEFVIRLMRRLLGPQLVVGSQMALTVLPGAQDQEGSVYHRPLFAQHPDDAPVASPPAAVRCLIPLVDLDGETGTIAVKKGSQRLSRKAAQALSYQAPVVPMGSCCLLDVAMTQKTHGNRTERHWTVVDLIYQRAWFVDRHNFRNLPPLTITSEEYSKIPGRHRKLFDWAMQPLADSGRRARVG